ncbi:VOC family protein [Lactobacillus terrae]|uniref:VOC family protein n=1 Tax=Lactobacillus terrae TaxID=2269374 RepID=UPI000C1B6D28|nr:glyoxalase/bleomycin resistance/extradiol dioxygenase family protein [Lactobacillus terrae]
MESRLVPYIAFDSAKEALEYYEEVFGAKIITRLSPSEEQAGQFGFDPSKVDLNSLTMHSELEILGSRLYAADKFTTGEKITNGITLNLEVNSDDAESLEESNQFFAKLEKSNEVKITMPYKEQFWGGKMGAFEDKYGVSWMLHAQSFNNK